MPSTFLKPLAVLDRPAGEADDFVAVAQAAAVGVVEVRMSSTTTCRWLSLATRAPSVAWSTIRPLCRWPRKFLIWLIEMA